MKTVLKLIVALTILLASTNSFGQECFVSAHNILGYSADMSSATGWTKVATVTDDTANTTPPEVFNAASAFKAVYAAGQSLIIYGAGGNLPYVVTGSPYRLMAYVKYSDARYLAFGVTGGASRSCAFDLQTGTAGTCSAHASITGSSITAVGNSWYRITVNYTGEAATNPNIRMLFQNLSANTAGSTLAATGGEILYISSPSAQRIYDSSTEYYKYVPTTTFVKAWGPARLCSGDAAFTIRKW